MFRLALILFAAMCLSDACVEHDIGYKFNGRKNLVGKVTASSADDCQRACQAEEKCQYWYWNGAEFKNPDGTCFLKSSKGKQHKSKGKISGPKVCESFVYDASVGRNAAEVKKIEEVFGPLECQKRCQETEECKSFIWNGPEKKNKPNSCQLKKGLRHQDDTFGDAWDIGRISGPKVSNGPFPTYRQGKQGEEGCPENYIPIKDNAECTEAANYFSYERIDREKDEKERDEKSVCYYCGGCSKPAVYYLSLYKDEAFWLCKSEISQSVTAA